MAQESFQYPETAPIFKTLEEISQRSSVSRGRAFEDLIRASVAALAAETMEPEYFAAIKEHTQGKVGKRGVDLFGKFFGQTVEAISQHDHDVLGDMFQTSISYGENAFYMTPQPIGQLMSELTNGDAAEGASTSPQSLHDPCCGTGILLIEAGNQNPEAELSGIDIDHRCADICAINLGLRSRYGWVICGNSLSRKMQYAYRIGSFFHEGPNGRRRGVIRKVPPVECPILPEIQQQSKNDLLSTLEANVTGAEANSSAKDILEIPPWVLRLELSQIHSQSNDLEPDQTEPREATSPNPDKEFPPLHKPPKPGHLF